MLSGDIKSIPPGFSGSGFADISSFPHLEQIKPSESIGEHGVARIRGVLRELVLINAGTVDLKEQLAAGYDVYVGLDPFDTEAYRLMDKEEREHYFSDPERHRYELWYPYRVQPLFRAVINLDGAISLQDKSFVIEGEFVYADRGRALPLRGAEVTLGEKAKIYPDRVTLTPTTQILLIGSEMAELSKGEETLQTSIINNVNIASKDMGDMDNHINVLVSYARLSEVWKPDHYGFNYRR